MADDADSAGPIASLESSPWGQCLNRTAEILIDLDLPDIGANVWIRSPPVVDDLPKPCIVISDFSPSHSPDWGTVAEPDLMLRAMIGIVRGSLGAVNVTLADRLEWYCRIFQAFAKRSARLTISGAGGMDVDCLYTVAEPGDPRIFEAYLAAFDVANIALGYYTRWPGS